MYHKSPEAVEELCSLVQGIQCLWNPTVLVMLKGYVVVRIKRCALFLRIPRIPVCENKGRDDGYVFPP